MANFNISFLSDMVYNNYTTKTELLMQYIIIVYES